jgi:5-deoxy-glucuronate isomerase
MSKVFGYPKFDGTGEMILTTYDNEYKDMLMDVRVYTLSPNQERTFSKEDEEVAILLLKGEVVFRYNGMEHLATREDLFVDGPYCVHLPRGESVSVKGMVDSEILVQSTHNDTAFPIKLYQPEDAPWKKVCEGKFGNVANRKVNTIFDLEIAPYSNMILGEIMNDKGNWSGYPPHRHPQPEIYYFRFERPEGFGASFVGDEVYKSVDHSFSAIPGGELHPQSAAPGYRMYTCWMIRHLDDNPWNQTDRNEDERYMWLHEEE